MRLEHVNLTVSDVERSVDFYSKLLDLQVRWEGRDEVGAPHGARGHRPPLPGALPGLG